ncbi:MAG TPA: glycosyltransferase [Longimicrobiales bacterium]|nr:glycosyltransferase [Longimicrobiales bacterium]
MSVAYVVLAGAALLLVYAFAGYPALLGVVARFRGRAVPSATPPEPPSVTVAVPVYNEERQVAGLLESLSALEYPRDRLRILVVSDGSTDGTNELVRAHADDRVRLLELPHRVGKTAAEAAGARQIDSELVLNTDASVRLDPRALTALVAAFADPDVGVASGRDVSVGEAEGGNEGERGYVGYEMRIRELETRVGGIVGASGSCYAIRTSLHRLPLDEGLSRDFAAALRAREHGLRAVAVDDALCLVPRASSLRREYRRKVRTMVRGMRTLADFRALLNPFRHGLFAWMLWSHKVARWLLPWAGLAALVALTVIAAAGAAWARVLLGLAGAVGLATMLAWVLDGRVPRIIGVPAWVVLGNLAAVHAALKAFGGGQSAIWEPTRRDPTATAEAV